MGAASRFHEHELGASWTQTEIQMRGSHALVNDGRVWLVDPVDSGDDVERAVGEHKPAGVIQLLDRHQRDCAVVAERLGVPHHRLPTELPESPFTLFSAFDRPMWREVGIWWPERKALIVAEAIGTSKVLAVADTGITVHLLLRLTPPGSLRKYTDVEHLLPGHGAPIHDPELGARIQEALSRSRRDLPRTLTQLPEMFRGTRT